MEYDREEAHSRPEDQTYLNGAVTVVQRPEDFMAYITSDTRLWDHGKTVDEAIGALARTHPEEFATAVAQNRKREPRVAVDLHDPAKIEIMNKLLTHRITPDEAGPGFGLSPEGAVRVTVSRKFFETLGGTAAKPEEPAE